jgi:hypothetical protein
MTARHQWGLRGPVHTCQIQHARHSLQGQTEERNDHTFLEFRSDGFLAHQRHRNPDGSEWTSVNDYNDSSQLVSSRQENGAGLVNLTFQEYDANGRLMRVFRRREGEEDRTTVSYEYDAEGSKTKTMHTDAWLPRPTAWGVEGTDTAYPAKGATVVRTRYNKREQPVELLFEDGSGNLLNRVHFLYDNDGHLVEEAQTNMAETLPPEMVAAMSEVQLAAARILLGSAGEPTRRTHSYDAKGRRAGTRLRIGLLSDESTTRTFNDHGDQVEEVNETVAREYKLDDEGRLSDTPVKERVSRSETRMRYDYDTHGNWVMKAVESQTGQVWSVEHRTISYFE